MKYIFGFAACFGVLVGCAKFGIEGGAVSVVAVLVAMMVASRFK